jgi:hypothetical protein
MLYSGSLANTVGRRNAKKGVRDRWYRIILQRKENGK